MWDPSATPSTGWSRLCWMSTRTPLPSRPKSPLRPRCQGIPSPSIFASKIIYPRGIGPTYELYSSSRRTAVVPCLRTTCNCFGYFSGLGNVASPSSNEHQSLISLKSLGESWLNLKENLGCFGKFLPKNLEIYQRFFKKIQIPSLFKNNFVFCIL